MMIYNYNDFGQWHERDWEWVILSIATCNDKNNVFISKLHNTIIQYCEKKSQKCLKHT